MDEIAPEYDVVVLGTGVPCRSPKLQVTANLGRINGMRSFWVNDDPKSRVGHDVLTVI